jgi:hypothetical protein
LKTIRQAALLKIKGEGGDEKYGGMQLWYTTEWQRRAGCGPTTAALLLWYLAQTRADCQALCGYPAGVQKGFLWLMEEVWQYVTPGMRGLNKTSMMAEGAVSYAAARGVALECGVFDIPEILCKRPGLEALSDFISQSVESDSPVGFLNLSNGRLTNLDNWHWVTIVGYDRGSHTALMYDQGRRVEIDLELWLRTTLFGGGFVSIYR